MLKRAIRPLVRLTGARGIGLGPSVKCMGGRPRGSRRGCRICRSTMSPRSGRHWVRF